MSEKVPRIPSRTDENDGEKLDLPVQENRNHRRNELESAADVQALLDSGGALSTMVVQGVDLAELSGLESAQLEGCIFWGCKLPSFGLFSLLAERGAIVIPEIEGLPFGTGRRALYSAEELLEGFDQGGYEACLDYRIYEQSHAERLHPQGRGLRQSLAERLHDHAIYDALCELVDEHGQEGVVAVMGGHAVGRDSELYARVARLGWSLARAGFLVLTGGGPGVMEAANLGASLSKLDATALAEALLILSQAPRFDEHTQNYVATARAVRQHFAPWEPTPNLAIPTWFYGHEPTNLFASAVAKFFDNAVREESVLALPTEGIVFAPGSAGTMQEIFQDLAQNHYCTYGKRSPMVFFGEEHREVYALIRRFMQEKKVEQVYGSLLTLVNDVDLAVDFLVAARNSEKAM